MAKRGAKQTAKRGRARTATRGKAAGARPGAKPRRRRSAKGPTMPLRDLVRGGLPRSPKAPRPPGLDVGSPFARRRTRTAHGLRSGSGLAQVQPQPHEWPGVMKPGIHKR